MRTPLLLAALLAALGAAPARAAEPEPPEPPSGIGLTLTPSIAGGGQAFGHDEGGVSELELSAGYGTGDVRPELSLVLGFSPGTYAAVRPGVRYQFGDLPFFARGALDWAHAGGAWDFRWLLLGGGAELRLTSVLGVFAEVDLGLPFTSDPGVGVLFRGGFAIRL